MGSIDIESPPLAADAPWIQTPLIESRALNKDAGCHILMKLETLQPSGSFKARGIGNTILSSLESHPPGSSIHFISSSGGNAGLAAVVSSVALNQPVSVVVPTTTSALMISKLRAAGATDVIQHGASWVEADAHLKEVVKPALEAKGETCVYVPPFDHEKIWEGNSSMIDELVEQLGDSGAPDAIICSVGGGGLINGVVLGCDRAAQKGGKNAAKWSQTHIFAMETNGADSLATAVAQKEHITLPAITSIASTLGARRVAAKTYEYATTRPSLIHPIVLEDWEAARGVVWMADEMRMLVELANGVCIDFVRDQGPKGLRAVAAQKGLVLTEKSRVLVVCCGGTAVTSDVLEVYRGMVKRAEEGVSLEKEVGLSS